MGASGLRSQLRGVVALDGLSGTGKSTAARHLASRLGARYLDTGAMYRGMTLAVLRAGVDPTDAAAVLNVVESVDSSAELVVTSDPEHSTTILCGEDVSAEIRAQAVTTAVSPVSADPQVRRILVEAQRRVIAEALDEVGGIVVEGRDIGTVVAPQAGLKVYLTASARVRAERRAKQNAVAGLVSAVDEILADIERRDTYDSTRKFSPAQKAVDAVEVDTTHQVLVDTESELLALVKAHGMFQPDQHQVVS